MITGAAIGIGRAIADKCTESMKVVLTDINKEGLAMTEAELESSGATIIAVPTDARACHNILRSRARDVYGLDSRDRPKE